MLVVSPHRSRASDKMCFSPPRPTIFNISVCPRRSQLATAMFFDCPQRSDTLNIMFVDVLCAIFFASALARFNVSVLFPTARTVHMCSCVCPLDLHDIHALLLFVLCAAMLRHLEHLR